MSHRGPDASGHRSFEADGLRCTLAAVRLRIIDLSPTADQPLANEDDTIWAVYNGELYNHVELRHELTSRGHRFRSETDGEVLTHLYEEQDGDVPGMLERLRGMFAFAIFDLKRARAIVARDRLGIKPLYWSNAGGRVSFASEVRVLVRSGLADATLDERALHDYMQWGTIQRPRSVFRDIQELAPGSFLEVGASAEPREVCWWRPEIDPFRWERIEARALFKAAFDDAVSRHLIADRPVGLFLSSGIDSRAIVESAARGRSDLRTLTVTFPEVERDEGADAAEIARELGVEHAQVPVTGSDVAECFEDILQAMDQPTSDGVNTWLVSRAARQTGLTVVLSGLGGDELFRGYPSFRQVPRVRAVSKLARAIPSAGRDMLIAAIEARRPGNAVARVIAAGGSYVDAYAAVRGLFSQRPDPLATDGDAIADIDDPRDAVMILELGHYLSNQLLRDTDQMSMSHSLEARVPWLDDSVVRAALSMPADLRERSTIVGSELASRSKVGFSFPFDRWLRGPLREIVQEGLYSGGLPFGDLIPAERRHQIWQSFVDGRTHWSRPWAIAVLRLWPAANGFTPST
jgi:asparagine synthase (glutamine-hydrolysing)